MRVNIKGAIINDDDKWVYDYLGVTATSPRDVRDALDKANGEAVDVEINSGGGDIFAGSEIYTALRNYKNVKIHIVGLAASAASVIAMAGVCDMSPTAMMMVHNVSTASSGDYNAMDKASDILQKANKTIAAAYTAKTGMTEADALAMMDKETWLTAEQAKEKGLIDSIMFGDMVACYNSPMLPKSVIDKIKDTVKSRSNQGGFSMPEKRAAAELKILNLKRRTINDKN